MPTSRPTMHLFPDRVQRMKIAEQASAGRTGTTLAVCADPGQEPASAANVPLAPGRAQDVWPEIAARAVKLASELKLPIVMKADRPGDVGLLLVVTPDRLELRQVGQPSRPVFAELPKLDTSSPAGRTLRQPLARAIGVKRRSDPPLTIVDATAGWGEDSWLMASLGCQVVAIERHGVVAALLDDALKRAALTDRPVAERISVIAGDARSVLGQTVAGAVDQLVAAETADQVEADVVYIDPMYPTGRKTAERKAMRVLRCIVGADDDAQELLATALRVARRRVVVKRPLRAKLLTSATPSHCHRGKALRYDVYMC